MRSSISSLAALLALFGVGCSCGGPALEDRDGGVHGDAASDALVPPDAPIFADGGPDAGHDGGPDGGSCHSTEPTPPTDPLAGDWLERFANPGVGGDLPTVEAFAFAGDLVYVGGTFTSVGYAPAHDVAAWDGADGWSALGDGLPGRVRALATDPAGVLWAAHASAGEWDPTHLARWDGTSWTEVATSMGPIQGITFVGTTLYAFGGFTQIGGVDLAGVARFDGTTWSGYTHFVPDGTVEALSATSASDVCIGGAFSTLGVIDARQAACWDGTTWTARSIPIEFYRGVFALVRDPHDGTLVAAGDFMVDDLGTNGGSIARWVTDHWELLGGGVMSELGPGTTKEVRGMAYSGDDLFIAGAFVLVDPASPRAVDSVARWDGTAWQGLGGLFAEVGVSIGSTNVLGLAVGPDGSVYFGGLLTRADSLRVAHVVRWDGTYFSALRTPGERYEGVGGSVTALARDGTCAVYVGGSFEYAGEVHANSVARFTLAGGYEALGTGVDGAVTDLAVSPDGIVVAGGDFIDSDTGTLFRNVAFWDGVRWNGLGDGLDGAVWGVAVEHASVDQPLVVYAAGTMTTSGTTPVHAIARWDGTRWSDLGEGMLGHPYDWDPTMRAEPMLYDVVIDPASGDVIVGGSFAGIGAGADFVATSNVARWDGTRWHAYGTGLGDVTGSVLTLGFYRGELVAAGSFDVEGSPTPLARWTGTAWEAFGTDGPAAYSLAAVEPVGDALFVGGVFDLGGRSAHVAMWNGSSWSGLREGMSDVVEALVSTEEGLYAGGTFDRAGHAASVGLALYGYLD